MEILSPYVESLLSNPPLLPLGNLDLDFFGKKSAKVVTHSTSALSPQTLFCTNNNNVLLAPQIESALFLLPRQLTELSLLGSALAKSADAVNA